MQYTKEESGCGLETVTQKRDVTGLNWNLKINLLHALQREEKGHEIPPDWTHPVFSAPGSAPV